MDQDHQSHAGIGDSILEKTCAGFAKFWPDCLGDLPLSKFQGKEQ
jgi:hypothetical protein